MNKLIIIWLLMAAIVTMGQAAPGSDWSAHWISATPEPGRDLVGASWIWTQEANVNPLQDAPACVRFFRRSIELPGNAPVANATVYMTADNRFVLFVNGNEAGRGDSWERPQAINITRQLVPAAMSLRYARKRSGRRSINAAGLVG